VSTFNGIDHVISKCIDKVIDKAQKLTLKHGKELQDFTIKEKYLYEAPFIPMNASLRFLFIY